ncbi:MAG: hypothetical protein JXA64_08080 [Candidatus Fermentibacteraceae bacterium]|nr:hypothetical protein [Candidatus Fermentibacteraceae bacterium]
MQPAIRSRSSGRVPYSSISLLLFASAVVFISVMILFSYISGVFDIQSGLEESIQAVLSEESAVELLAGDLSRGSVSDYSYMPSYGIDDQITSFQITGIESTPPEEIAWSVPGDTVLQVVPLDDRLVVISGSEGVLRLDLLTLNDLDRSVHLADLQGWEGSTISAAALQSAESTYVFVVFVSAEAARLTTVFPDGSLDDRLLEVPFDLGNGIISAGFIEDVPSLVISDGSSAGLLFDSEVCSMDTVSSPQGTTPVFVGEGAFFSYSGEDAAQDTLRQVTHVLLDDFTGDRNDDLVFVCRDCISILDSGRGGLMSDFIPGGNLVAWGTAEGRGLLSARWILNSGQERWRIYIDGRFMDSPGPEFLPLPWEGRIAYSRNSMLGSLSDSLIRASENTGELIVISPTASSLICDVEGIGPDVIDLRGNTVRVHLNPLEGNGLHLTMRSLTRGGGGEILLQSIWDLTVYGSGQDKRVRWERSV